VQKRALPIEILHHPIRLDATLPVAGGRPYEQRDRPIRFLHTHECLELGYCYSGSGVFVVGGKVLPFAAGDVSFINHTEPHLARSAPGTSSHWTWVYLDPVRLVGPMPDDAALLDPTPLAGPGFRNLLPADAHPQVNRVVLRIVEELRDRRAGHVSALRALAWELMTLMRRLELRATDGATDGAATGVRRTRRAARPRAAAAHGRYDRLAPALGYLAHHYMDPIDVAGLAARCDLSPAQFRRRFAATLGRSPRAYWHDLRMRMAGSLLRNTSRSVLEISQDVGFDTLSSFNRVFKATHGVSPRAWRKRGSVERTTPPPF
jgi:AraC-like DNA-binding protein